MTIYDAAPALLALAVAVFGTTLCLVDHRRIVKARAARRAAKHDPVAAE